MQNRIKNGLFIFILAVLFLPFAQHNLHFINSAPLNGEYIVSPDVAFTWKKWWDGSYYEEKSKYINDNMGLRPDFIRMTNQIDYSLFEKIHSEWRLLGSNSCIYQDVYVYSYMGRDYNGYDSILKKVMKLKAIQDTLARLGKSLIFVHAPCKALFYPEYIPQRLKRIPKSVSNFETYIRIGDSLGLNQVDFSSWFASMKDTSKELLYPKQGFHWSTYGSLIAADSFISYVERLRNIHMVHPVWKNAVHTTDARGVDDDIAKSMNLIFPLANETFTYPEVTYPTDSVTTKPKFIFIGDSFLFQWMNEWVLDNVTSQWTIWYYFHAIANRGVDERSWVPVENTDWLTELKKTDCIVVMYTSRNLSNMGNGFIEKTYAHFYPGK